MDSQSSPTSKAWLALGVLMLLNAALFFQLSRRAQENSDITISAPLGFERDNFGQVTPAQGYAASVFFALCGSGMIIRWFKLSRRNLDK